MDREEAAGTLELLRKVVAKARDDTAAENWGVIWVVHGVSNAAGFLGTHWLLHTGHLTPGPYMLLWAAVLGFNFGTMGRFRRKNESSGSFIEKQIWSIWTTFIVAMSLTAVTNYLVGLSVIFMPEMTCVLVAVSFSTMGSMMGGWWYVPALVWAAMALVIALVPRDAFALLGALWLVTQGGGGIFLERARRRKLARSAA
jgi:hypothetical protein